MRTDVEDDRKNPPKQRREPGVPNKLNPSLAAALADESAGAQWGPCMKALSDKQKAFVLALYQLPPGYGVNVRAAKMAGYGTNRTTWKCWSVIGSRVAHDEKVLAAIAEEDKKRIRASAPRAIRALDKMVEDPDHRDHIRAVTAGARSRAPGGNLPPRRGAPHDRSQRRGA